MTRRLMAAIILVAAVACGGPVPPSSPTPGTSASPSLPAATASGADRQAAAREVGLDESQLVAIEEGFVAGRWNASDELELVWARPANDGYEAVVLAAVMEPRVVGISTNPVVCPSTVGLTRTLFIFGQVAQSQHVSLTGARAAGGAVVNGVYALALDSGDNESAANWTLTNESGARLATSDPTWFTQPATPPDEGALCSVATH